MKKSILILAGFLVLFASACEKEDEPIPGENPDELYQNSPSSPLPADFLNSLWFWGNSGPISYYDHDGNHVGSAIEAGRQYKFSEVNGQGRLEFEQYLGTRNASNCVTDIYTRKRGTVKFESNNLFTFYPVTGSFKTIKSGTAASCSKETIERPATAEDLKPIPERYEIKIINGEKLLYAYNHSPADSTPVFVYQRLP